MNNLNEQWNKYAELSIKELTKTCKQALTKAAATLKANTQRNVLAELGDVATERGRYFDTLVDGVRVTKYDNKEDSIAVHIMGNRAPNSGTYRLRFFEGGTVNRQTTGRGKEKYFNKDIPAYHFFDQAIKTTNTESIIVTQIDKAVEKINR